MADTRKPYIVILGGHPHEHLLLEPEDAANWYGDDATVDEPAGPEEPEEPGPEEPEPEE